MTSGTPLPATIASRYLPVRQIGRGGMGVVYEVVHARTGEHLALKVLLASAGAPVVDLHRFKQEARASAKIRSENVVRVLDADTAPELNDAPFLVMELLEGLDLERAATRSLPSPVTVVDWLRQIAPALDKAHRLGIVHRDLKPDNLFLAETEGRPPIVKILDFGIAKITDESSTATASGQVLGTPRYMAPEQVAQDSKVSGATDLYALGLVAYRLLAGECYYRGPVMGVLAELLHGVSSKPSTRHPQLGAEFDGWFLQACHRDPSRRFGSAVEQIEALAAALGLPNATSTDESVTSLGADSPAPASPVRGRRSLSRQRVALGAAGVVLVASAFGYRIFSSRQRPDNAVLERPAATPVPSASRALVPRPVAPEPVPAEPVPMDPSRQQPAAETAPANVPAQLAPPEPARNQVPRQNIVPSTTPPARAKPPLVLDPYRDQK